MFVLKAFVTFVAATFSVEGIPVVFKESTPNGQSIVAISSSDPNVEKYFTQQFATRSGFKQVNDEEQSRPFNNLPQGLQAPLHSTFSIAVPGKALAGGGRSFASASSGPFLPIFTFPIGPDGFDFNNFDLKDWVRNVESFYNPNFPGNGQVNTATAINDNGHIYGNVNAVKFDNRESTEHLNDEAKNTATYDIRDKTDSSFDKNAKNMPFDDKREYRRY